MTASTEISNKKVIIIGAGLAGLTLANSLKKRGIPFEVYERDASIDARAQGWSLTLHFALKTLKECVPEEAFENFSEKACVVPGDSMSFAFMDGNTGAIRSQSSTDSGAAYRIHRSRFRKWLLQYVQDEVHWNKKVSHYEENFEEGTVTAFFSDGAQATGDILVATDGGQSPVACQLLGGKENFDALTNVLDLKMYGATTWISKEEWASVAGENPSHIRVVNSRLKDNEEDVLVQKVFNFFCTVHTIDESKGENCVEVLWAISRWDAEHVLPRSDGSNNAECLKLMKFWARNGLPEDSVYRRLVVDAPEDTVMTPLTLRERIPTADLLQAPNRRVVLVGDAAHPMSIFRGEGGNHAIIDAGKLAVEIDQFKSGYKTLDEALDTYYTEMIPRCKVAVETSHDAAIIIHTKPDELVKMYQQLHASRAKALSK